MVFTDVLIVGRLDVDAQSFAPIDLHKMDTYSDWLVAHSHKTSLHGMKAGSPVTKLIGLHKLLPWF